MDKTDASRDLEWRIWETDLEWLDLSQGKPKREYKISRAWFTANHYKLKNIFRSAYAGDLEGEDYLTIGLERIKKHYQMVEEIRTGIDHRRVGLHRRD